MTTSIFSGTLSSGTLTAGQFLLLFAAAIALGLIIALVYSRCGDCTKSFAVTLALLPGIVCVVILMVSGSIGAGVAVAGTFSLVRFRSAPGTARELLAVFLAMAAGLACGMGCVAVAAVFTVLVCLLYALLSRSHFGEEKNGDRHRTMHITVPERLTTFSMPTPKAAALCTSRPPVSAVSTGSPTISCSAAPERRRRSSTRSAAGTGIWRSVSCSAPPRAASCKERRTSL